MLFCQFSLTIHKAEIIPKVHIANQAMHPNQLKKTSKSSKPGLRLRKIRVYNGRPRKNVEIAVIALYETSIRCCRVDLVPLKSGITPSGDDSMPCISEERPKRFRKVQEVSSQQRPVPVGMYLDEIKSGQVK